MLLFILHVFMQELTAYILHLRTVNTYAACHFIELCQIVVTLSEIHFILPWSRSRTRFHHVLCFYTRSKQISIHPQNKTPSPCMTHLSQKYIKDMGLCKKKIKDAYPKKVNIPYWNEPGSWKGNPNPCIVVIVPGSVAITYITHFRQKSQSYQQLQNIHGFNLLQHSG